MENHHFKSGFSLRSFFFCVLFEHKILKGKCRTSDSCLSVCLSGKSTPTGSWQSSRNKDWRKMGRNVKRYLPQNFALDKMCWCVDSGRTCRRLPCSELSLVDCDWLDFQRLLNSWFFWKIFLTHSNILFFFSWETFYNSHQNPKRIQNNRKCKPATGFISPVTLVGLLMGREIWQEGPSSEGFQIAIH